MKRAAFVLVLLSAGSAYALPPVVPAKFDGMALVRMGTDSACRGSAPFMFTSDGNRRGFRIILTSPPCFNQGFKINELIQVQPTGLGTLWAVTLRIGDPGGDDGPLVHMLPGDPSVQAQMQWGEGEVLRYNVIGSFIDPTHFQIRYREAP